MQDSLPRDEKEQHTATESKPLSKFNVQISLDHADIPILACCLVSGLCDASVYAVWSCFVSMQTGMSSPYFRVHLIADTKCAKETLYS